MPEHHPPQSGHIEVERRLDSITVGVRHRKDPGDIAALMRSIEQVGLLQPITITPDGFSSADGDVLRRSAGSACPP